MAATATSPPGDDVTPANADVHNMFLRSVPQPPASTFEQHPDSAYAHSAVGNALAIALSEVASLRPDDPVEYVAQRLLNYRATMEHCQRRDAEVEALKQARIRQQEEAARQRAVEEELEQQRELAEQRKREELERLRQSVPLGTFALPAARREERNKTGATPLHVAVRSGCNVETLLRLLHDGFSFCARDVQGANVKEAAVASKNDAVVKEIDSLVIRWLREEKLEHLRWLLAADYGSSLPSLKKAFGPKLKGLPEASRRLIDAVPQAEARYRELWKLSARGTKEHLEAHCRQLREQSHTEDGFSRSREGLSALHVALLCKNQDAAQYLVGEFPALLNMPDGLGRLPIHYAYGAGQEFVDLVRKGVGSSEVGAAPLDALGFAPTVYAKRYDLLPEQPNYGSPDLLVTGDDADETGGGAAADADADAAASSEATEGAVAAAEDETDQSKLTPINEDEGED